MRDVHYHIVRVTRADGKVVWRCYENNNYLDEFMSKERAENYLSIYKRMMR